MNRRDSIKSILAASAATVFFTGCSDMNVAEFLTDGKLVLNQKHMDYLSKISDAILPISNVSNKIGSPVTFIMDMVNDTYKPEEIVEFATGFEQYKLLMQDTSSKLKSAKPEEIISTVKASMEAKEPQEELLAFINSMKGLSVQNFKSSEYFMTEKRGYKMIPDPYEACIEV